MKIDLGAWTTKGSIAKLQVQYYWSMLMKFFHKNKNLKSILCLEHSFYKEYLISCKNVVSWHFSNPCAHHEKQVFRLWFYLSFAAINEIFDGWKDKYSLLLTNGSPHHTEGPTLPSNSHALAKIPCIAIVTDTDV